MTTALRGRPRGGAAPTADPWHALWALMVGFFMILVDATIVAVANKSIMGSLGVDYDAVIWVTSAYLLAYAVPLLVAGRLGDRFGPKNLYLVGLAVFTAASLWCGLSGSIGMLIAARVLQGVGAALLTPQTLSTITRIFPAERRGVAMSLWGATAGVATLVGPLAGGVLVGWLGWQWIFFVNVPIGIVGLGLAYWLVPDLPTEKHGFDPIGVLLSGIGMFMVVFALQEGQSHDWAPWIWGTLAAGVGVMAAFVFWQQANRNEPLIPLVMFRDRNFSLSNFGVATIGFVVTAMILSVMFYAQVACGLSEIRSALLTAPMAITSGGLAPVVGKLVDRYHPRPIIGFGFSLLAIGLTWLSVEMTPTTAIWRIVLPLIAMGAGMAFIWSPLAATATRNLPPQLAGAGSGVYNTTRQVGSVLGSAGMAAFMTSRINAELPFAAAAPGGGEAAQLPDFLREPFATAMSQSLLLPAFVALFGVIAAMFLLGFGESAVPTPPRSAGPDEEWEDDDYGVDDDDYVEFTVPHPVTGTGGSARPAITPVAPEVAAPAAPVARNGGDDEGDTEPMAARHQNVLTPPVDTWHDEPVQRWHSLLQDDEPEPPAARHRPPVPPVEPPAPQAQPSAEPSTARREPVRSVFDFLADVPAPRPSVEPIGFAHNGFHVDDAERFQPLSRFEARGDAPSGVAPRRPDILSPDYPLDIAGHAHHESPDDAGAEPTSRHGVVDDESRHNGRHSRIEPGESRRGRHYRQGD